MNAPADGGHRIRVLSQLSPVQLAELTDLLVHCVDGGASVSFMQPLAPQRAMAFWQGVGQGVADGERLFLVAEDAQGGIAGTVHLVLAQPENQPHRAELVKMMVHGRARCQGLGAALMRAAESAAAQAGKTLLVLDTVTGGAAERLYRRLGWVEAGRIPGFALHPQGGLASTTLFYKAVG